MLHVPLLSEAYEAALFHEDRPQPPATGAEPGGCGTDREPLQAFEPATPPLPDPGDEDLETAPTRPLKLDRLHL